MRLNLAFNSQISRCLPRMYNLRKRRAGQEAFSKASTSPGAEPEPRGLETGLEEAVAVFITEPALGTPLLAAAPPSSPKPGEKGKKKKVWEDVGLKVDTSRFLLGALTSPTADAALLCGPAASHLLTSGSGFTRELLEKACQHLAAADRKLVPYIETYGPPERLLSKRGASCFASLAKSIVFQQLATSAASAIYGRVLGVAKCEEELTPEALVAAPVEELRGSGLSERKVSYLLDLCRHFQDGHLSNELIAGMDDASLQQELTKVKGIGAWTCDMFAMFHLGHPDILPVGDLGVRRGMQALYELKDLPDAAMMERIAASWRPFRSCGCYYMWRVEVPRTLGKKGGRSGGKKHAKPSSNSRRPCER